ncbi:MAG: hypothetical protein EPO07_08960 [Verrucomicrobia bacterium]|nr:MAG: hypothetical protein EPO07_08960 [Verrucomicrobiota bacterium]
MFRCCNSKSSRCHYGLSPIAREPVLKHIFIIPTRACRTILLWLGAAISVVQAATNTVINANSTGTGSLRQAITSSAAGDTIRFDASLSGQTIVLTNGALVLNKNLTIDASALPGGFQISGNHASRVFEVSVGVVATLSSLTIRDGYAPDGIYPANSGGGILNRGTLTLTNCTVANNQAVLGSGRGGGGIENNSGTLTLHNCTISGNSSGDGGGIESYYSGAVVSTLTVNQSTVAGNSASTGGGMYLRGNATVNQSTVTGNSAFLGSGIYALSGLNLFNSIVAGNNSGANLAGSYTPSGTNLISDTPLLAPLGNYGGRTPTTPPLAGSPAVDAGAATPFTTDQRGFPRPVGLAPDIGAVEGVVTPPILLTNLARLTNGSFQFEFTSLTGRTYTVLASTNVALPLGAWSNLGLAVETLPGSGQFQFTDPQAATNRQRFYRIRVP